MKRTIEICVVILCALVIWISVSAQGGGGQTVPSNAGDNTTGHPAGWPTNSNVTVYMNTNDFGQPGSAMWQAVVNGFEAVRSAYAYQNVTFNYVPTDGYQVFNPQYDRNLVVLMRDSPSDGSWARNDYNVYWDGSSPTADVMNSIIRFDPDMGVTNGLDSLTHWTEHEESHNFFLGDCWYCGSYNTIMDEGEVPWDDPSLQSPTYADIDNGYDYSWGDWDPWYW